MISWVESGIQRLPGIESYVGIILWFRCHPAPRARLGIVEAAGAEESRGPSALVRRAGPAPHRLFAADPPSIGGGGLRFPLQEGFPRDGTARPPRAAECRTGLSGRVARGLRESVEDGKSDCGAVSGSCRGTRVRKTSSHRGICLAMPNDSMEALDGLDSACATGRP